MSITPQEPHKFEAWEDAATITTQLWDIYYHMSVVRMAASLFPDAPKGIRDIESLLLDYANTWHEYANTLIPPDAGDEAADK